MLFSNATNWRGVPFKRLKDFILEQSKIPDFTLQATEMSKEELQYTDLARCVREKREAIADFIE